MIDYEKEYRDKLAKEYDTYPKEIKDKAIKLDNEIEKLNRLFCNLIDNKEYLISDVNYNYTNFEDIPYLKEIRYFENKIKLLTKELERTRIEGQMYAIKNDERFNKGDKQCIE